MISVTRNAASEFNNQIRPHSQINQAQFAAEYRDVVRTMAPGALSIAVSLRAGSVIATAGQCRLTPG